MKRLLEPYKKIFAGLKYGNKWDKIKVEEIGTRRRRDLDLIGLACADELLHSC